jgi:hypothetical protein
MKHVRYGIDFKGRTPTYALWYNANQRRVYSNVCDARRPCVSDSFHFLDEFSTCDLGGTDSMFFIRCDWGMLVWVVEWVPQ